MSLSPSAAVFSGVALLSCLAAFAWVSEPAPELEPVRNAAATALREAGQTAMPATPAPTLLSSTRQGPRTEPAPLPARERLGPAIASGLPPEKIAELLDGLSAAELGALFEAETHMGLRWMQERGIDAAGQRRLAALWLSMSATPLPPAAEGAIAFRGHDAAAVPSAQEHQVNAAFAVPAGYRPDSVIVRWVDLDRRSVVSLDRHLVTAGEQQEVWMRNSQDWKPGRYRVEIFAADAGLQALAGASLDLQDKDPQ